MVDVITVSVIRLMVLLNKFSTKMKVKGFTTQLIVGCLKVMQKLERQDISLKVILYQLFYQNKNKSKKKYTISGVMLNRSDVKTRRISGSSYVFIVDG